MNKVFLIFSWFILHAALFNSLPASYNQCNAQLRKINQLKATSTLPDANTINTMHDIATIHTAREKLIEQYDEIHEIKKSIDQSNLSKKHTRSIFKHINMNKNY